MMQDIQWGEKVKAQRRGRFSRLYLVYSQCQVCGCDFSLFLWVIPLRMYSFWCVYQLRDELRRRNASLAGKKADLIERYVIKIFEVMFN